MWQLEAIYQYLLVTIFHYIAYLYICVCIYSKWYNPLPPHALAVLLRDYVFHKYPRRNHSSSDSANQRTFDGLEKSRNPFRRSKPGDQRKRSHQIDQEGHCVCGKSIPVIYDIATAVMLPRPLPRNRKAETKK